MSTLEEKAQVFIRAKEDEVENLFKDWHVEKLASEMADFAKEQISQQVKEALERAAEKIDSRFIRENGYKDFDRGFKSGLSASKKSILSLIKEY